MTQPSIAPINHDYVVRVAALVVKRLRAMAANSQASVTVSTATVGTATNVLADVISDKVIGAKLVERHPRGTPMNVRCDALITPLARDTAKDRNIQIIKGSAAK